MNSGGCTRRTGATFILVTHNQDEALSLSDRMAVMHKGRIEQVDAPARFFETPANAFVARFVGIDTLLRPESVVANAGLTEATVAGQTLPVHPRGAADPAASVIAIRPDRLFLAPQGAPHALMLTVVETTFRGLHRDLKLAFADGQTLVIAIEADADIGQLSAGQQVAVGLEARRCSFDFQCGITAGRMKPQSIDQCKPRTKKGMIMTKQSRPFLPRQHSNVLRRDFLKLTGAGGLALAAGGLGFTSRLSAQDAATVAFWATATLDIGDKWPEFAKQNGVSPEFTDNGNDLGPVIARLAAGNANDLLTLAAFRAARKRNWLVRA